MEAGIKAGKSFDLEDGIGSKAFRENLQNQGHDGIIITRSTTDTGEPRKDYVVFDAKIFVLNLLCLTQKNQKVAI